MGSTTLGLKDSADQLPVTECECTRGGGAFLRGRRARCSPGSNDQLRGKDRAGPSAMWSVKVCRLLTGGIYAISGEGGVEPPHHSSLCD